MKERLDLMQKSWITKTNLASYGQQSSMLKNSMMKTISRPLQPFQDTRTLHTIAYDAGSGVIQGTSENQEEGRENHIGFNFKLILHLV